MNGSTFGGVVSGAPWASTARTIHTLVSVVGGAGSADTRVTFSAPFGGGLVRFAVYGSIRGSFSQVTRALSPPASGAAPGLEDDAHAKRDVTRRRSRFIAARADFVALVSPV